MRLEENSPFRNTSALYLTYYTSIVFITVASDRNSEVSLILMTGKNYRRSIILYRKEEEKEEEKRCSRSDKALHDDVRDSTSCKYLFIRFYCYFTQPVLGLVKNFPLEKMT